MDTEECVSRITFWRVISGVCAAQVAVLGFGINVWLQFDNRLRDHEAIGGHDVMDQRVTTIERRTDVVEERETEALERMEEHMKRYVDNILRSNNE